MFEAFINSCVVRNMRIFRFKTITNDGRVDQEAEVTVTRPHINAGLLWTMPCNGTHYHRMTNEWVGSYRSMCCTTVKAKGWKTVGEDDADC